jgi:hypothetical protein
VKLTRALALALAGWFVTLLVWVLARRLAYPYDLEWMEGGMLGHALRIAEGQPLYAPPSVDFIPYLYTPLYPALLAGLGKLFGIGYLLGRLVSLISFAAALVLGYVFIRRESGSRAAAATAMAIPCAAFVPMGAWYDLARPDSLFLGLVVAGLLVGWWQRSSHVGGAVAALLLVAAFFAKQTATPFMFALGAALLLASPRVAVTYCVTLALTGIPALWWLNHATDGWFWTYVSELHRKHDFYAGRAFLGTPGRLLLLLGPGVLLVPWALKRRRSPGLLFATWIGLAGIAAACVSFGTQWAFTNAFIPGIFLPAISIGTAAGRLLTGSGNSAPPRLRPATAYALLATTLLCAPGGLLPLVARVAPQSWAMERQMPTGYDPRRYLPSAGDRAAGDALLARLRDSDGEVLIPFHPFYAHLAGKRAYLHRMGVLDIWRAGLGSPRGMLDAFQARRFALVVMDDKIDGNWQMWPGLLESYHIAERIAGPHVPSGAATQPRYLLVPNHPPAPADAPGAVPGVMIDRELQ